MELRTGYHPDDKTARSKMLPSRLRRAEARAGGRRRSLLPVGPLRDRSLGIFLGVLAALAPGALRAQGAPVSGSARVTVLPSPVPGRVGTTLTVLVRVDLSGANGKAPSGATVPAVLGAYQIKIAFDRALLRFDSASGGTAAGYAGAPTATDAAIANAAGAVTIAAAQTDPMSPSGLAVVASLAFQVLDHGAATLVPTPLSLSTALQPGPPAVGLAPIPGVGVAAIVPLDVASGNLEAQRIVVDVAPGPSGNGNGILEPGEQVIAIPSWKNVSAEALSVTGAPAGFAGPAGASYAANGNAAYGTIDAGLISDCLAATGNCYGLAVSVPTNRPAAHWDAFFTETPSTGDVKTWALHVGGSFTDVPTSHLFYRTVETIFHDGITGGCGATTYCPEQVVTRAQMAIFLLKSRYGSTYVPPLPSGTKFLDVPFATFAAGWIEDLASRGITSGCGAGNYCPTASVTRASMAVLLLRTEHGSAYAPPSATGMFSDVPASDLFAKWIEQLAREGVTGGCGGGKYCPGLAVTRGQMAAFLAKTFKLSL